MISAIVNNYGLRIVEKKCFGEQTNILGFGVILRKNLNLIKKMKKTIFIAYSHDSEEHKMWVMKFANDLSSLGGFEILLDQNLPKGSSLTRFMEIGLKNADKVLIIGTPLYKQKSEMGKGAAFEGTIISTELMKDIDSIKFYPILRAGTFETSFPVILQGRVGDDLSNDADYDEKLKIVVESISDEKPIPAALLRNSIQEQSHNHLVATVNLSQGVLFETYLGNPTGNIQGIAIDVEITNTTKEIRYFNQPLFKLSVPLDGDIDSFSMLDTVRPIYFPLKLEYGQQDSVSYKIIPENIELFSSLLKKDPKATIKAIVTTTLGERVESDFVEIAEIVKNAKYVR